MNKLKQNFQQWHTIETTTQPQATATKSHNVHIMCGASDVEDRHGSASRNTDGMCWSGDMIKLQWRWNKHSADVVQHALQHASFITPPMEREQTPCRCRPACSSACIVHQLADVWSASSVMVISCGLWWCWRPRDFRVFQLLSSVLSGLETTAHNSGDVSC